MNIKTGFLAIVISLFMMISVPVAGQETDNANVIAAEISAKMADGKSLKQAVTAVSEKYAREVRQFPNILISVFTAIAIAARKSGINANSTEYYAAVLATSEIMINTPGISKETVAKAAMMADIEIAVITGSFIPRLRLASIIANKASSGGSAASP